MKRSQRVVLAAVSVVVVVAGGYWWQTINQQQATTGETANWKTYRDDVFKFTIKYPGGVNVSQVGAQICSPSDTPVSYVDIEYSDDVGGYGIVRVASQGAKVFCGSPFDSRFEKTTQSLVVDGQAVTLTGYVGKDKLHTEEQLQFNPDNKNTIYLSIPDATSDAKYENTKSILLEIIQTYRPLW